jgi:hypothetical protein
LHTTRKRLAAARAAAPKVAELKQGKANEGLLVLRADGRPDKTFCLQSAGGKGASVVLAEPTGAAAQCWRLDKEKHLVPLGRGLQEKKTKVESRFVTSITNRNGTSERTTRRDLLFHLGTPCLSLSRDLSSLAVPLQQAPSEGDQLCVDVEHALAHADNPLALMALDPGSATWKLTNEGSLVSEIGAPHNLQRTFLLEHQTISVLNSGGLY